MKVKDFIKVYNDAYLTIETKEAVYTDSPNYAIKANIDNYYNVPIIFFKDNTQLNSQVLEKEITEILASTLEEDGMTMFYVVADIEFSL